MSNFQTPSRYWGKQKTKLKMMFSQLEDKDFDYEYGEKEKMLSNLVLKIGTTRPDLNELISDSKLKKKVYK